MVLVLRRNLDRPLTKDEVDDNFVFLNTEVQGLAEVVEDLSFVKTVALLTPDVDGDISVDPLKETLGVNSKVDKVAGKGLSSEDFTSAEKAKLAGLQGSHFRGTFISLAALQAGVASPVAGDYADVDTGVGTDATRYIWDVNDAKWVSSGSAPSLTAAQVKTLYESNPDTNAFTDAQKAKLAAIQAGATANQTDAYLLARGNHTGTQLASTISDLAAAIAAATTGKLDKSGGTLTGVLNYSPITTLSSSATLNIGFATSNVITVSGTTGITSFGTVASGATRTLIFSGILTITHNATSMILPNGVNFTTSPGDVVEFVSLGSGNWKCVGVTRASGSTGGGLWVGTLIAWPLSEASIPGGSIANNGQLVDRATWPELWTLYSSQSVSDATWLADPLQRGKPSTGNGSTTFRMPDLNGKYSDGLTPAAAVLRGHGKNSAGTPGLFQLDQLQNITGDFSITPAVGAVGPDAVISGAFKLGATTLANRPTGTAIASCRSLGFDASGSPDARTGTETRGTNVTVVWITVGATGTSNPGTVDVTALATHVTAQDAVIATLQRKPFVSSQQTITSSGTLTFTHSLGVVPSNVSFSLVCAVADAGFAVGDEVAGLGFYSSLASAAFRGFSIWAVDADNLALRFGQFATVFAVPHKTTGAFTALVNTSWKIIMRIYP